MTEIRPPKSASIQARLAAQADLAGNADGVATRAELAKLAGEIAKSPVAGATDPLHPAAERDEAYAKVLGKSSLDGVQTLAPELQKLPAPLRQLALEIDGNWGNADGQVTAAEIDRVARYYLAALPFFAKDAHHLLELAEHLGYAKPAAAAKNVLSLRLAIADVDKKEVARGASFRALFDEAVAASDVPGLPGLLRDAAQHNPRWHRLSILEHTAVAVDAAATLAEAARVPWKNAAAVMLLHDVGKLTDRQLTPESDTEKARYHFGGHEEAGAAWLRERGVDPDVAFHVAHHADLRSIPADELFEQVCGGDPRKLQEVLVVYVADQVAKGDAPDQLASFAAQEPKIRALCETAGLDAEALLSSRRALIARWFDTQVS